MKLNTELDQLRKELRSLQLGGISKRHVTIVKDLYYIGGPEAAFAITEAFRHDGVLDAHVGFYLYLMGNDGHAACVRALEGEGNQFYRSVEWLMNYGNKSVIQDLKKILKSDNPSKKGKALEAMGHLGVDWVDLVPALNDEDHSVRREAIKQLQPRRNSGSLNFAIGAATGDTQNINREETIMICEIFKKEVPTDWSVMEGVGSRDTLPVIEKVYLTEKDPYVISELRKTYLKLLLKYCHADEVKKYEGTVGRLIFETFEKFSWYIAYPGNSIFQDYINFCKMGGIDLSDPLYHALRHTNETEHPPIKEMLDRMGKNIDTFGNDNIKGRENYELFEALISALKRIEGAWVIDELVDWLLFKSRNLIINIKVEEFILSRPETAIPLLQKAINKNIPNYLDTGIWRCDKSLKILGRIGTPAVKSLIELLRANQYNFSIRNNFSIKIVSTLLDIDDPRALKSIIESLETSLNIGFRERVISILSKIDDPQVNIALEKIAKFRLFNREPKTLREAARNALKRR